jgi:formate hydrogenlyase subunit 4
MFLTVGNILILLFLPFLLCGAINRLKAFWAGRQGPPLLQPLFDFLRLLRKSAVVSTTSSYILRISAVIYLSATICAALFTPLLQHQALLSMTGDFVVFAYLLALAKFFLIINALDTGSSFEGMGASREAAFTLFVEPALFMFFGLIAALSGHASFQALGAFDLQSGPLSQLVIVLGSLILFMVLLTEGARVPVDDPNTHLELTMIHEVMVLDSSGPDLAFFSYGNALKMTLIGALLAGLVVPAGTSFPLSLLLFAAVFGAIAIAVGSIEALVARLRLLHLPQFVFIIVSLTLVLLAALLVFNYGGPR